MSKQNKNQKMAIGILVLGVASLLAPLTTFASFARNTEPSEDLLRDNAARRGEQPGISTDMGAVFNSGTSVSPVAAKQFYLPPGLYDLGPSSTEDSDHYLLVEKSVNNDSMGFALLIPKNHSSHHRGEYRSAYFYQMRPIKSGTAMMLAPIALDSNGNTKTITEDSSHMPYLEVSLANQDGKGLHFPYIIKQIHGQLSSVFGNQFLVMRPALVDSPRMLDYPSTGVYNGWSDTGQTIVISGDEAAITEGSTDTTTYKMVSMNSDDYGGKIFQLSRAEDNSRTGEAQVGTRVEKLAVYLDGCFFRHFLVLSPIGNEGEYMMHAYLPREKSLKDLFIPIGPRKY